MRPSKLILFACILFNWSCSKELGSATDKITSSASIVSNNGGGNNNSGVLTAGEWNDFANWDFWTSLNQNDTFKIYQDRWGFYPNTKWKFIVKDNNQQLVADADIYVLSNGNSVWKSKTNKFGEVNIIPDMLNSSATNNLSYLVKYKNQAYSNGNLTKSVSEINISLPITVNNFSNVDVMFVVDATGSMGDEISYLKNELLDVLNRANNSIPGTMRYSSVFYRDLKDEYVTKFSGFTTDKNVIVDFVKQQNANGGDDFPEAVEEAFKSAMQQSWSLTARARLLFIICDAPPHDDQSKLDVVRQQIKLASEKGITIIPVAASGADKATEFILRYFALSTNGTYCFLTDDSGIGNSHTRPTVGNYNVEFLNDLLVRLINKYGGN